MIFIIFIILFLLISLLVVYIIKRYRRRGQIPQSSIPIKLDNNKESAQEKTEIESITITKQSSNKTNNNCEQNYHREHLIDEQAFSFNEDSDNEKDEEMNSSGNQSSDHKQNHVFQFQEHEQKLDELIESEN
ncbi:unnamed protein product [Paramecium sonneborni]|uniref:Transmembrane protein n=1 Tax=Paramecium sonneborni TaxID=65129 RepID=A0A8S1KVY7_9CILI|nr:unnamed protein product [Paramecium sonneborni]